MSTSFCRKLTMTNFGLVKGQSNIASMQQDLTIYLSSSNQNLRMQNFITLSVCWRTSCGDVMSAELARCDDGRDTITLKNEISVAALVNTNNYYRILWLSIILKYAKIDKNVVCKLVDEIKWNTSNKLLQTVRFTDRGMRICWQINWGFKIEYNYFQLYLMGMIFSSHKLNIICSFVENLCSWSLRNKIYAGFQLIFWGYG